MSEWIPVKERLPEENDYKSCHEVADGDVLWTNEDGLVGMGYYYESTKRWSDINDCPISVIAWMPLPEPYRCGMNKEAIKRLMYLRGQLENRIDNIITEYYMRDKEFSTEQIKDTLDYCIEDALRALKQGR